MGIDEEVQQQVLQAEFIRTGVLLTKVAQDLDDHARGAWRRFSLT